MPLFRKKPVTIEARRYVEPDAEFWAELGDWGCPFEARIVTGDKGCVLYIVTREGVMEVSPGDWIIKGVEGEFYPCSPSVFEATYEAVH